MANLYYAGSYKNKIINLLLANKDFITLLSPQLSEYDELDMIDVLLGGEWIINGKLHKEQGHVFDYNFVNDHITEKKTFVFVETDIESVRDNIFTDFNLYVHIFADKDIIRLTEVSIPTVQQVKEMGYFVGNRANRIDVLCDIVDRILNGTDRVKGIGRVRPAARRYMTIYQPANEYYGKCLKYTISNYNDTDIQCRR